MNEFNLIESKELREQAAGRVEVLDKVKELLLLPQLEMMTMQQVADYYEVDLKTANMCYLRNKEEINLDGASKIPVKSMNSRFLQNVETKHFRGYMEAYLSEDVTLRVPNAGIILFPKRAILRIGMLLRDSEIAKEVRTQLLNIVENSSDEVKTKEVNNELSLFNDLGRAIMHGSMEEAMVAVQSIVQYQQRHIEKLSAENEEIKSNNQLLAADILRWDNRPAVNKAIRVIAGILSKPTAYVWKELYDELRYKHGIGLTQRGKSPFIQYVREDEWPLVQQSLSAICEKNGVSPSYVLQRAKLLSDNIS